MPTRDWYTSLNPNQMQALILHETDEGKEIEIVVPFKYEVCDRCNGKGTHVNPAVDGHGISPEEFEEDPDFKADYLAGAYDITCEVCGGLRVEAIIDEENVDKTPEYLAWVEAEEQRMRWEAEERHARKMGY